MGAELSLPLIFSLLLLRSQQFVLRLEAEWLCSMPKSANNVMNYAPSAPDSRSAPAGYERRWALKTRID